MTSYLTEAASMFFGFPCQSNSFVENGATIPEGRGVSTINSTLANRKRSKASDYLPVLRSFFLFTDSRNFRAFPAARSTLFNWLGQKKGLTRTKGKLQCIVFVFVPGRNFQDIQPEQRFAIRRQQGLQVGDAQYGAAIGIHSRHGRRDAEGEPAVPRGASCRPLDRSELRQLGVPDVLLTAR